MNIHITSDWITRATRRASGQKRESNKVGGIQIRIEGLRASACFASRRYACRLDLTGWIGPGDDGCSAAFPRSVPRRSAPGDERCTFSKDLFILFDINVLRLRLATAERTDSDPGKVTDGQHSEAMGVYQIVPKIQVF